MLPTALKSRIASSGPSDIGYEAFTSEKHAADFHIMFRFSRGLIAALLSLVIAGCATPPAPTSPTEATGWVQYGQVIGIRDVTMQDRRTSGAGSFLGGLAGSILGSLTGSGHARTVGAVGGALGGGIAGNELEKASKGTSSFTQLSVRLDSGDARTYRVDAAESFRVGDRVTVTTSGGTTRVTR